MKLEQRERRCSNYVWVINNFIANSGASCIRGLTVDWFIKDTLSLKTIWMITNLCDSLAQLLEFQSAMRRNSHYLPCIRNILHYDTQNCSHRRPFQMPEGHTPWLNAYQSYQQSLYNSPSHLCNLVWIFRQPRHRMIQPSWKGWRSLSSTLYIWKSRSNGTSQISESYHKKNTCTQLQRK